MNINFHFNYTSFYKILNEIWSFMWLFATFYKIKKPKHNSSLFILIDTTAKNMIVVRMLQAKLQQGTFSLLFKRCYLIEKARLWTITKEVTYTSILNTRHKKEVHYIHTKSALSHDVRSILLFSYLPFIISAPWGYPMFSRTEETDFRTRRFVGKTHIIVV